MLLGNFKRKVEVVNIQDLLDLKNQFDKKIEEAILIANEINNFKLEIKLKEAVQNDEQQ